MHPSDFLSEDFLAELEAELAALRPQYLGHRRVAAVEHSDLTLVLLLELVEHLVPIWPPGLCPRLQSSYEVSFFLRLNYKMSICSHQNARIPSNYRREI